MQKGMSSKGGGMSTGCNWATNGVTDGHTLYKSHQPPLMPLPRLLTPLPPARGSLPSSPLELAHFAQHLQVWHLDGAVQPRQVGGAAAGDGQRNDLGLFVGVQALDLWKRRLGFEGGGRGTCWSGGEARVAGPRNKARACARPSQGATAARLPRQLRQQRALGLDYQQQLGVAVDLRGRPGDSGDRAPGGQGRGGLGATRRAQGCTSAGHASCTAKSGPPTWQPPPQRKLPPRAHLALPVID